MAEVKTDRKQALELAISTIEAAGSGKGSVMRLGAGGPLEEIAVHPHGGALRSTSALGCGGGVPPRPASSRSTAPESSGKTDGSPLHIVSEAQRLGRHRAAFIDGRARAGSHLRQKARASNIDGAADLPGPNTGEAGAGDHRGRSCAPMPWTSSSSTPSPPSCRAPSWTATWATRCRACRRASCSAGRCASSPPPSPARAPSWSSSTRSGKKIGVMFGCFEYDTPIVLARREPRGNRGEIVEQRLPVDVLSYDPFTDRIGAAPCCETGSTTARPTCSFTSRVAGGPSIRRGPKTTSIFTAWWRGEGQAISKSAMTYWS